MSLENRVERGHVRAGAADRDEHEDANHVPDPPSESKGQRSNELQEHAEKEDVESLHEGDRGEHQVQGKRARFEERQVESFENKARVEEHEVVDNQKEQQPKRDSGSTVHEASVNVVVDRAANCLDHRRSEPLQRKQAMQARPKRLRRDD